MSLSTADACLYALQESRSAAGAVARLAGVEFGRLEERQFEGGEFKLRPLASVRGRSVFVYQSLAGTTEAPVAARVLRLLFLLRGLRDAGAADCVAVVPYMAFARKDRRTQPRDPVTHRYLAELLECAGASRVMALDVHNAAAFDNAFRIPTDHLTALPLFVEHIAGAFGPAPLAVLSPDIGGIKRAQILQELLQERVGRPVEFGFIEKRRALGVVSGEMLVGRVSADAHVIIVDDLCATGGTLRRAADICRDAGSRAVHVAVTHTPSASGIQALEDCPSISSILATDSAAIPLPMASKLVLLGVAPLFGEAIRRQCAGEPLSPLLRRWPPVDDRTV